MKFKTLDWIRKVRNDDYEITKNMNPKEKIEYTKKMAEKFAEKCLVKSNGTEADHAKCLKLKD